jgi:5'-nucleotidase
MNRVMITNDDGIDSDGISALASLARTFFNEVWIIAPREQASQIGHRVTTHTPIYFEKRGERVFAVDGTPADCTRVGFQLMGGRPDWVWSGINHGGNLGRHDYYISGTLAAAREAAFFGVPSFGASHYMKKHLPLDWESARIRLQQAFLKIKEQPLIPGEFWNINLPHLAEDEAEPGVIFCSPEKAPLDVNFHLDSESGHLTYNSSYHNRARSKDSDVDVCFGGNIAISKLEI